MTGNEAVTDLQRSAEEEAIHCVRCGLCLSVCPGYRESLIETDSPRARVALVRALKEGLLEAPTDGYSAAFFRCLLCGACTFVCPSGVAVNRILELTRGELASLGLLPEVLSDLDARIAQYRNISAEANEGRLIWADNLPTPPTGMGKERAEVAYFVGCVSSFFPRSYKVPQSLVQIFDRARVDYALLGGTEWCCGYPMFINGELERARDLIHHNVEAVQAMGARKVVVTCASCYHFWKHSYPAALEVEDLGLVIQHATEFLADLLETGNLKLHKLRENVTYHDPCDLGRKEGVSEAPRRVLAQIPGLRLVEMAENRDSSHCCGGGGNLESFAPEMSRAVARHRICQAAEVGAGTLISACQQCERTLTNAARAERIRIRVKDITEVVLEAMEE
ncbi:MAG: (Fe-S)-binding protein [Gemmatimonadota bacterium]|nr:MAG: (Fe-S)-binding protein [Gemmatimonadota bacterium]